MAKAWRLLGLLLIVACSKSASSPDDALRAKLPGVWTCQFDRGDFKYDVELNVLGSGRYSFVVATQHKGSDPYRIHEEQQGAWDVRDQQLFGTIDGGFTQHSSGSRDPKHQGAVPAMKIEKLDDASLQLAKTAPLAWECPFQRKK